MATCQCEALFSLCAPVCRRAAACTGDGQRTVRKAGGEEQRVSSHVGAVRLDAVLEEPWTVPSLSLPVL